MYIQMALLQLSRNIRREMNVSQISIYEFSIHLGLSESVVESILDGEIVMTYYQFSQICQKLWDGREDPFCSFKAYFKRCIYFIL